MRRAVYLVTLLGFLVAASLMVIPSYCGIPITKVRITKYRPTTPAEKQAYRERMAAKPLTGTWKDIMRDESPPEETADGTKWGFACRSVEHRTTTSAVVAGASLVWLVFGSLLTRTGKAPGGKSGGPFLEPL